MTRCPIVIKSLKPKIKHTIALAALVTMVVPTTAIAGDAPIFSLPGNNADVELAAYRGQVVYVDFWASWCAPCRESFPFMNELHDEYAEGGLKVIAINLDSNHELARQFIGDPNTFQGIPRFDIAYDPEGNVAQAYEVKGMPSSYLIDRDGNIVYEHLGFRVKDQPKIEARIVDLLESGI